MSPNVVPSLYEKAEAQKESFHFLKRMNFWDFKMKQALRFRQEKFLREQDECMKDWSGKSD